MPYCELTCPWCKSKFPSVRNAGKYCSLKCSVDSRIDVRNEDDCWPWTGGIFLKDGYGRVSWDHTGLNAHRVTYEIHVGPVPEGFVVRHTCDNPICCNYKKHLIPGTVKQNSEDAVERGLYPRGASHYHARLTPEQVLIIRSMPFEILAYRDVAELLDCSLSTVYCAHHRKTWSHL
jgi:hypothetical protein